MDQQELITAFQNTLAWAASPALQGQTERAASSSTVYFAGFAAARKYLVRGKTAVLNFANPENPGGGVLGGAMAQEECLCRSSNLYVCLTANALPDFYQYHRALRDPFYSDRLIYTEGVTVFKDDCAVPNLLDEKDWFQVDVITCAAPYLAKRSYTNKAVLKERFKSRIKNIFEAALIYDIDVLILGAFGCGAFKNPPEVVAKAFHEVIDENGYDKLFSRIVFAIKSTTNGDPFKPCPNLMAFETEFDTVSAEAGKLRFSDGWGLAQTAGSLKMPSGKILKGAEQFEPYLKWRRSNRYFGKQFSVLGDSISTLAGFNPPGYAVFYAGEVCGKTGVQDMADTWWGKVIDYVGGELLVNNAWSGCRVTRLPGAKTLFPSGCSDERTGGLHIGSVMPDVILVYLGTNDWAQGADIGEPAARLPAEDCEMRFDTAYEVMLDKLSARYPHAEIWCCTLCTTFMPANPLFVFPCDYAGTHIEAFNEVIRTACQKRSNTRLIDLYRFHIPYAAVDGTHPTADGMGTLASLMLHELCDRESVSYLECAPAEHDFIKAEEYSGGTKYVCRKCGLVDYSASFDPLAFERAYAGSTVHVRKGKITLGSKKAIVEFTIYYGDLPIVHYKYKEGKLFAYNRINGSRDGGKSFPPGFFDTVEIPFSAAQHQQLSAMLAALDLHEWGSDETALRNRGAPGFCAAQGFSCRYADGKEYACTPAERPSSFIKLFELLQSFGSPMPYPRSPVTRKRTDADVIDHDPAQATLLCSPDTGIELFNVNRSESVTIHKTMFYAGRRSCDLPLEGSTISREHAAFHLIGNKWCLQDECSANGTKLNGTRLIPRKLYVLHPNDTIEFGEAEKFIFFKSPQAVPPPAEPKGDENEAPKAEPAAETEEKPPDPSPYADLSGQVLAGRYTLVKRLSYGGTVQVYLGRTGSGEMYSVKVHNKEITSLTEEVKSWILQIPHMMMQWDHPAIPKVFDIVEDERYLYIVSEWFPGESLSRILEREGALPEETLVSLGIALADALRYLHTFDPPYIFRNMRPSNVFVTPSGGIKLIDFGWAVPCDPAQRNDFLGFPDRWYTAPEQLGKDVDPKGDIYSLGITMCQLATGLAPQDPPYFGRAPLRQMRRDISRGFEYICQKCIALDPKERYQSCTELLFDLNNIQDLPPRKGFFRNLFASRK